LSLRVKRGNLIKQKQDSLCVKRARTEGAVSRRNIGNDFDEVSTFGQKEKYIDIFLSTRVNRLDRLGLMNESDELNQVWFNKDK
jgi:hypothetical protein